MRFLQRAARANLALLIGIDQLAQTLLLWPFAVAGWAHVPDPDETISELLGRHVAAGRRWAILPARVVDALFLILTGDRHHCARAAGLGGQA